MENKNTFFEKIGKWFKNIFVPVDGKKSKINEMLGKPGFHSMTASVVSIITGVVLGYIVLLFLSPEKSTTAILKILVNGFSTPIKISKVLYQAAPLIMTGLAVAFAFKTGLFNIGASGQYTVGAMLALIGGIVWQLPWWACMLLAMVGGAVWGSIPGIFKALLNVNEVITSIMFNWIGMYFVNLTINNIPQMIATHYGAATSDRTANLAVANPNAILPKWGLDKLFGSNYMNIGIIIAIVVAILMFVILNKTTFGYELKACGFNRNASKYAGINAKRNIILSMTISGALAGIGGGIYYLSGIAEYTIVKSILAMGFNGIPVALLGASNPIAVIFSGLFISYIKVGGESLQPDFTVEIINIIIAAIIYMSALSLIMKGTIAKIMTYRRKNKSDKDSGSDGSELVMVVDGSTTSVEEVAIDAPTNKLTTSEGAVSKCVETTKSNIVKQTSQKSIEKQPQKDAEKQQNKDKKFVENPTEAGDSGVGILPNEITKGGKKK